MRPVLALLWCSAVYNITKDLILLDFSKAFNKVPHKRLLYKINYYGIRHSTNQWIANFLEGRTQQILVEGVKSTTAPVHSGVP